MTNLAMFEACGFNNPLDPIRGVHAVVRGPVPTALGRNSLSKVRDSIVESGGGHGRHKE